ncbi:hypothetical protein HHL19_36330 [Streptomyces sp. R302]|uniref:hypothetical protein n=1 Tax=unclassified Streptomyces TaxID=2593676 RepID=UPI00145CB0F6|nr:MULTISPECIES: hypothetical protein [unclassified Streptomyces]NML55679.1 hypothetical protein [Streptomyces sp. R301]NML83979.1 hypothetical protein [Streptomyces sp. R302]
MLKRFRRPRLRLTGELAVIRPGDRLLVHVPHGYAMWQTERVKEALMSEFPGVTICVVSGVTSVHVYRGERG